MVRDSFAVPYKQLTPGLQAVPAVAAQIPLGGGGSAVSSWVEIEQIVVSNPTAGALTFTVKDLAGNALIPAVSLAVASVTVFSFPRPVKLVGAATWVGSAAGLIAEVKGYYL
jgi:hypothetical protein